jgi:hypothetical protein
MKNQPVLILTEVKMAAFFISFYSNPILVVSKIFLLFGDR